MKGFSLIEILVAVSIFAVAAVISSGALLSASDAQQKILSLRVVQDNLSYALDIIGKEARTGRSYHCGVTADDFSDIPRDCASAGGPSFTFRNSAGDKITYRLNSGRIEKVLNGNPAASLILTSSDANITSLTFYVVGAPANDHLQPRLTIVLRGTAGLKEKIKSHLNIQTTISQRIIDS
ncbi:MAG: prepilin-type N-terminal cleavage/methylation domain-containing protein [Candidatus Tagabacteria bacterium]